MQQHVNLENHHNVYVDVSDNDRIRANTPDHINRKIDEEITRSVRAHADASRTQLSQRIDHLDREWDVDRATMLLFASLGGFFLTLGGVTRNKRWLAPLAVQLPFLAYHAVAGWCPPMSALRRLGFRSGKEIDAEKYALKTIRGDFRVHH
jgi:hypothetical protein